MEEERSPGSFVEREGKGPAMGIAHSVSAHAIFVPLFSFHWPPVPARLTSYGGLESAYNAVALMDVRIGNWERR